jgi:hypothetical protein
MRSDPGVDALICAIGDGLGIPDLALDGNGCFALVVDGRRMLSVALDGSEKRLVASCAVARLPSGCSADTLRNLLRANFLWRGSAGATLALAPDGESLTLLRAIPLDGTQAREVLSALDALLDAAERWAKAVESGAVTASGPAGGGLFSGGLLRV